MLKQGYVQVYTGTGKGKTTASLGLAVRAAGAGMKVLIIQFMKQRRCSEHAALERFSDLITVKQYGTGFVRGAKPSAAALKAAQRGLSEAREALAGAAYDLIILDEINVAVHCGLLGVTDALALIDERPASVELVFTGRYADKKIMAKADLVTEMREVKHYFKNGVASRKGIEC
jgi:cob(I)alamin adenosyltransferase